jgi:hypothetical protein
VAFEDRSRDVADAPAQGFRDRVRGDDFYEARQGRADRPPNLRYEFARAIGERVGVADALVLAHFDQPLVDRWLRRPLDEYVAVVQASDAMSASSACGSAGFTR